MENDGALEKSALDSFIHALQRIDLNTLDARVLGQADTDVAFFDVMIRKDGTSLEVIVDGRSIWPDLSLVVTKDSFKKDDGGEALKACIALGRLAISKGPADEEPCCAVIPFRLWCQSDEADLWKQFLEGLK